MSRSDSFMLTFRLISDSLEGLHSHIIEVVVHPGKSSLLLPAWKPIFSLSWYLLILHEGENTRKVNVRIRRRRIKSKCFIFIDDRQTFRNIFYSAHCITSATILSIIQSQIFSSGQKQPLLWLDLGNGAGVDICKVIISESTFFRTKRHLRHVDKPFFGIDLTFDWVQPSGTVLFPPQDPHTDLYPDPATDWRWLLILLLPKIIFLSLTMCLSVSSGATLLILRQYLFYNRLSIDDRFDADDARAGLQLHLSAGHFFSLGKCFVGKILAGNWFTKLSSIIIIPSSIFVLIKHLEILFNFKIKWPILSTLFCKKNAFFFLTSRLEIKYIFYWLG